MIKNTLSTPNLENTTAPQTQAAVSQPGQSESVNIHQQEATDQPKIISDQPPAAIEEISVQPPLPGMEANIVETVSVDARGTSASSSIDDTNHTLTQPVAGALAAAHSISAPLKIHYPPA